MDVGGCKLLHEKLSSSLKVAEHVLTTVGKLIKLPVARLNQQMAVGGLHKLLHEKSSSSLKLAELDHCWKNVVWQYVVISYALNERVTFG